MGGRLIVMSIILTLTCFMVKHGLANDVGVNWGRKSRLRLLPSNVVDMVLSDGVRKVKLHSFYENIAKAFTASNLELMVTIPNLELGMVKDSKKARAWVKQNVTRLYKSHDVNVKYLMVGNEPYTIADDVTKDFQDDFDKALFYVTQSIRFQPSPYNQIKVSVPHAPDVLLPNIKKPSEADFDDVVMDRMLNILHILNTSDSPFCINIYPHISILQNNFPLEFAFFDKMRSKKFTIQDGQYTYTNVFDFVYDSFVSALRRYGYGNLKIIVTQVGWPTDGHIYANISTAQRFYRGFLKKMARNQGTPLLSGVPIDTYLYNLNDENAKEMNIYGPSIRHYGLYDYKGQPKFHIDLTMKGRKHAKLVPAEGVVSMPRRWCIVNENANVKYKNRTTALLQQFKFACEHNDCSRLYYGASYNNLTLEGNVSYAFNIYYQSNSQIDSACDFGGFGKVTPEDPSNKYGCHFPLEIISTLFIWGQGEMGNVLASTGANAIIYSTSNAPIVSPTIIVPFIILYIIIRS